jgi:filamentous hemagglutinin family protein
MNKDFAFSFILTGSTPKSLKNRFCRVWHQAIAYGAVQSTIALSLCWSGIEIVWFSKSAFAQIIPDNTLGAESSVVNPINNQSDRIDGGALRGSNLFHSFKEFNIGEGRGAYFTNPAAIKNIFSRVTGSNPSRLFGKLGVLGNANLFFINPNGIIFGPNASLDIRGSFVGSTANAIKFPDGSSFSAKDPFAPVEIKVEVKPLIGIYFEGTGHFITNDADLKVGKGQSITLFGRKVTSVGTLTAPGGTVQVLGTENVTLSGKAKIDVSSETGGGTVLIGGDFQGKGTVPNAATTFIGKDVSIKADALTNGNGGKVIVWADKLTEFYGNISAKGGSVSGNGGFVEVSGKEQLIFKGNVDTNAVNGKPGTLLLDPTNIVIENGSADSASDGTNTFVGSNSEVAGSVQNSDLSPTTIYESELEGLSGNNNVILQAADNITLKDLADNELSLAPGNGSINLTADGDGNGVGSFVMQDVADTIKTNGRDINISGASLNIANIDTSSAGNGGAIGLNSAGEIVLNGMVEASSKEGNGGDVTLNANGNITINPGSNIFSNGLLGGNINLKSSADISVTNGAIGSVNFGSRGTGGDVNVMAMSLSLVEGAELVTLASNRANAGNVIIQTENFVSVVGSDGLFSAIASQVRRGAEGNAGNVTIETGSLRVVDGGQIASSTSGKGNGASLTVQANFVEVIGFNPTDASIPSALFVTATPSAIGNAGNISIETNSLRIADGGQIGSGTFGRGNGGFLRIQANSVEIIGSDPIDGSASSLFSSVQPQAEGNAGNLMIETDNLRLVNGGQIQAVTFGQGNGGELRVRAQSVEVIGSDPFDGTPSGLAASVQPQAEGNAGNLTIETNNLRVADGGLISANTLAKGNAGTINIQATSSIILTDEANILVNSKGSGVGGNLQIGSESLTIDKGRISAETTSNRGGNINLQVKDLLLLRNGSKISTTAGTAQAGGDGGNININAGFLVAVPRENSDITANAFLGNGGNINVNAQGILGIQFRQQQTPLSDITASSQFGLAGTVNINASQIETYQDIAKLPEQVVAFFFSVACGRGSAVEFFNIGRGGSLPTPYEPLTAETLIVNWIDPIAEEENKDATSRSHKERSQQLEVTGTTETSSSTLFVPACAK